MDTKHGATSTVRRLTTGGHIAFAAALGLSARDRALLRAVEAGRCDLVTGVAPEIRVDGRWYCDQARAHDLIVAGLLTSPRGSRQRGPAELTTAGRHALAG